MMMRKMFQVVFIRCRKMVQIMVHLIAYVTSQASTTPWFHSNYDLNQYLLNPLQSWNESVK